MDNQLSAIITLCFMVVVLAWIVRFVFELVRMPRGSIVNAFSEADFDHEDDDRRNPILRDRRMAEAHGEFLT